MLTRRTFDFLPTVFQTETNKKFLNATVDQLVQEPAMTRMSSYVGRAEGSSVYKDGDAYLQEGNVVSQYYQLEPSLVVRRRNPGVSNEYKIDNVYNYVDLLNKVAAQGGINNDHDRLFNQEYYNYQGFINIEKLINYNQYYWVPNGPDSVSVNTGNLEVNKTFMVTRPFAQDLDPSTTTIVTGLPSYNFTGFDIDANPTITLVRGGEYRFTVNQPGYPFFIQTAPGVNPSVDYQQNISKRDVKGVTNNGTDEGTVTFNVPKRTAQDAFVNMPIFETIDLVLDIPFKDIQNAPIQKLLSEYRFDGVRFDQTVKYAIFTDQLDINWLEGGNFDNTSEAYDTVNFDQGSEVPKEKRKGIWELSIDEDGIVKCIYIKDWTANTKLYVREGREYGGRYVYKDATLTIKLVPNITATLDTLYYQDGVDPDVYGIIKLVDPDPLSVLNINDILGKKSYTSPNGVKFTNGLKVKFTNLVEPEEYKDKDYIVEGVGTGITLHFWRDFVTPETYTINQGSGYDADGEYYDSLYFDNTLNAPIAKEYITISRASTDGNPWSRGNRWFHKDVLSYSASILTPESGYAFDDNNRGKRPIIEFRSNLKLFESGKKFLTTITAIDVTTTDALSIAEGSSNFYIDGVELNNNQLVIFANDSDSNVRKTIYQVNKISITGSNTKQVHLVPVFTANDGDTIIVISGVSRQGKYYYWSESNNSWGLGQQKTFVNQDPLFDLVDRSLISFGNRDAYPSTNFIGSKLFSYKRSTSVADNELGFGITYRTIGNIGDIVFENNYDSDSFNYNSDSLDVAKQINTGNVQQLVDDAYVILNPWVPISDKSAQLVEKKFTATFNKRNDFDLKVIFENSFTEKNIYVTLNGKVNNDFTLLKVGNTTLIRFTTPLAVDDKAIIKIYGKSTENSPLYTIPKNLEKNSLNDNFTSITLGQMREHLIEMSRNSLDFRGEPAGSNNFRDIDYIKVGGSILQHSATIPLAQLLFNNGSTDVIAALEYNRSEYSRFKEQLFFILENREFRNLSDPRAILDEIMQEVTALADSSKPFYFTDMMPYGKNYIKTSYTIFNTFDKTYNSVESYDDGDFYKDILLYLNQQQLLIDRDYTVNGRVVTLKDSLNIQVDDVLDLYEYASTLGCMIPATPTKMGMYPKFEPVIYIDNTIIDEQVASKKVIQGHDGSITLAFNDFRDDVILEYEKRIYNTIHIDYYTSVPDFRTVEPGAFRETAYTLDEWTHLLSKGFLFWAGRNNVDFYTNNTSSNDLFSYNYSEAKDKLFDNLLPGYWRAIYRYFYDTDRPHTHPWEVAGYTVKPDWWEKYYGPAPYTSGNLVMWEDLEAGVYYDNNVRMIDPPYVRPGLTKIIPVDENGLLLPPTATIISEYNTLTSDKKWRFGDQGPAETAWRRSSDYAFSVMIAYALAKPAEFCSYTWNTRDYVRDEFRDISRNQIINVRTNSRKFNSEVTGIDRNIPGCNIFVRDRLSSLGLDINENLIYLIDDLTVNLAYKLSGYSDKKYLQVLAEQSSPQSKNTSVLIPPEDYELILSKSAPVNRSSYSGVIVEKVSNGYAVRGFDNNKPYFVVIPSIVNANNYTVKVGNNSAVIYSDAEDRLLQIPYGTTLTSKQQVADFLISYGRYLTAQGFIFDSYLPDQTSRADWTLAVKEFLFFTQQGWDESTVISLSPPAGTIKFNNGISVVDNLTNVYNETRVISSDSVTVNSKDYRVYREGTQFEITLKDTSKAIHFIEFENVQYEHALIFNNTTVFNDVIYESVLGNRQQRLKIIGRKTKDWNGSLYAPGFLVNHKPVDSWKIYQDYYKGEIVKFKNKFYTAINFIPGKARFEQNDWFEIENTLLEQKLIPTPAFNAKQFENFYDVDTDDINVSADSQARHSTGFQPRSYFTDIGLDTISQHKFYLGMIGEKGTNTAINKFLRAKLPYIENNIELTEEWAFKLGSYGNTNNKNTVELPLKNIKSVNNTVLIELLNKNDLRSNQWNTFKPNDLLSLPVNFDKNIFTKTNEIEQTYATSGYVQIKEVAATVFDVNKISNISSLANILGEGSRIWVASDIDNSWNVYRASNDYGMRINQMLPVSDTEVEFATAKPHGLQVRDKILIKNAAYFDGVTRINISGIYKVTAVSLRTFKIEIRGINTNFNQASVQVSGLLFKLKSVRYATRKDFAVDTPYRGWKTGDLVYIDNVENKWQVLTNFAAWKYKETQSPVTVTDSDNFGQNVVFTADQKTLAVSSDEGTGKVYVYGKDDFNDWSEVESISGVAGNVAEFGKSVAINNNTLVVGAPGTENAQGAVFVYDVAFSATTPKQIIYDSFLSAESRLGDSVTISADGNWIYITATNEEEVYAYKKIKVDDSADSITHTASGIDDTFVLPDSVDTAGLYADQIKVFVDNVLMIPYIDYDMNISQTAIVLNVVPDVDAAVKIEYSDYYYYVDTISNPGIANSFGKTLRTSTDGRDLLITAHTSNNLVGTASFTQMGEVYYYRRSVEAFIADGITATYNTTNVGQEVTITVDGIELSNDEWTSSLGLTFSLVYVPPTSSIVEIETNNFQQLATISAPTGQDYLQFGHDLILCPNNCSIYVGAPGYSSERGLLGSVYRYINVARLYGTITGKTANPVVNIGDAIRLNNFRVEFTGETIDDVITDINLAGIPGVSAERTDENKIKIITNSQLTFNKLTISNDNGTGLENLGLELFPNVQLIESVYQEDGLRFGERLAISANDASKLLVGSTKASSSLDVTFDSGRTRFDSRSTTFKSVIVRSGAVYLYEYQTSNIDNENDIGQFAYASKFVKTTLSSNDAFGTGIALGDNWVFISSPKGNVNNVDKGTLDIFNNARGEKVWAVLREETTDVDSNKLARAFIYNSKTNTIESELPVLDGPYGKHLPSVLTNIKYTTNYDPAVYNVVPSTQSFAFDRRNAWGKEKVGTLWWDTNAIKYLDWNQGNLNTKATLRDQLFPSSAVDIYQWVESDVPPTTFNGNNAALGLSSLYTVNEVYSEFVLNDGNTIPQTKYYFWVKLNRLATDSLTNSSKIQELTTALLNPRNSSVPFISVIASNAIALYNCEDIVGSDHVLKLEYNRNADSLPIHNEWSLFPDNTSLTIPQEVYNKIVDSFAGEDSTGRLVPDPSLKTNQKYGLDIRPRQAVFNDPITARKLFVDYVNEIFSKYPIRLIRNIDELIAQDPYPTEDTYDESVENDIELSYLSTDLYLNKIILVKNDSLTGGWTLRELVETQTVAGFIKEWHVVRAQKYNNNLYWTYADWYASGYSATYVPTHQVDYAYEINNLVIKNNDTIKIKNSVVGGFQLVKLTNNTLELVGQQAATVQISNNFYNTRLAGIGIDDRSFESIGFSRDNSLELRKIFNGIVSILIQNAGVFVEEFRNYYKDLIQQYIDLITTQFVETDWLFKTSFISIDHEIRRLDQIPVYVRQPEQIIEDYINEVKPYHAKIREYLSTYPGDDLADILTTDFDLPPFYDTNTNRFKSPQLEDERDTAKFSEEPYKQWFNNYDYEIGQIEIVDGGTGYTNDTILIIPGGAKARVKVRANGVIYAVIIENSGSGYTSTPEITIQGVGTGAKLLAILQNKKVRNFKTTIKFDRYTRSITIPDWQENYSYSIDDTFVYNNIPYRVIENFTSGTSIDLLNVVPLVVIPWEINKKYSAFDIIAWDRGNGIYYEVLEDFTSGFVFDESNLIPYYGPVFDNAIDRTWSYYKPSLGMPGRNLPQLMKGLEYPGVKVLGPTFDQEPGFDVSRFDTEFFDAFEISPEGVATIYGPGSLDTTLYSEFTDSNLGIRPEDIITDGADFVDVYSSHAPEELVPGRIFDALDIKVTTTPYRETTDTSAGPEIKIVSYNGDNESTFAFNTQVIGTVEKITVYTKDLGFLIEGTDYNINWENYTIETVNPITSDDIIYLMSFGMTGESIIVNLEFRGDGSTSVFAIDEVTTDVGQQFYVKINGQQTSAYTAMTDDYGNYSIEFNTAPAEGDYIQVHAFNVSVARKAYSSIKEANYTVTGGAPGTSVSYPDGYTFTLPELMQYSQPWNAFISVRLNNEELAPANNKYYEGDGSSISYMIPSTILSNDATISDNDLVVVVDNVLKQQNIDYLVVRDGSSLPIIEFIIPPADGAKIVISDTSIADYRVIDNQTLLIKARLTIANGADTDILVGDKVTITMFSNHDMYDMRTQVFVGLLTTASAEGGFDTTGFDSTGFDSDSIISISTPSYYLSRTINNPNYIQVFRNGGLLKPYVDYNIYDNVRIDIIPGLGIVATDVIHVRMFSETLRQPSIKYRIFKNMLNETEYLGIGPDYQTTLVQDLAIDDDTIYVYDASKLSEPGIISNQPGVVFINGERITYWQKNNTTNTLTQIRRSTGGTGGTFHSAGSVVEDASVNMRIPDGDKLYYNLVAGGQVGLDGSTLIVETDGLGLQNATTSAAKYLKSISR